MNWDRGGIVLYRVLLLWFVWLVAYWCFRIAMALSGEPGDAPVVWYTWKA